MDSQTREITLKELNEVLGTDVLALENIDRIRNQYRSNQEALQEKLVLIQQDIPAKLEKAEAKVNKKYEKIDEFLDKTDLLSKKVNNHLDKTKDISGHIRVKLDALDHLESVLKLLEVLQSVENLSNQLNASKDDEQSILFYTELKQIYNDYKDSKCSHHLSKAVHHWHNELKEKLEKEYNDILLKIKWPNIGSVETALSPDLHGKFTTYTKYLFLLQLPTEEISTLESGYEPSVPVRFLIKPLKKRFIFHFASTKETARIDKPEWFLRQTLLWMRDCGPFLRKFVQPVCDKLQLDGIHVEDEFNRCLSEIAAERLHIVLQKCSNSSKTKDIDPDSAFAHAVDEALIFSRDYLSMNGKPCNNFLGVLTKAEIFVRWLALEKKYALAKMEEMLCENQWMEAVGASISTVNNLWIPRAADWFISMLQTIENRYSVLPSPGHRVQFLELQLELCEDWHLRLSQILRSTTDTTALISLPEQLLKATAVINAAHYTRTVLLQWSQSLPLLQLHYYRRQFQHFTELQHKSGVDDTNEPTSNDQAFESVSKVSLTELESTAEKMARSFAVDAINANSTAQDYLNETKEIDRTGDLEMQGEDFEVFDEIPSMLAFLRDSGLKTLVDHIMMEFKADIKEYKRIQWYVIKLEDTSEMMMSKGFHRPLSSLTSHLNTLSGYLAPSLMARVKSNLAHHIDEYLLEEVVFESWWNVDGAKQFRYDVMDILSLVFQHSVRIKEKKLPKLTEACAILNMDYETSIKLQDDLSKVKLDANAILESHNIRWLTPAQVALIFSKRTDLSQGRTSREPTLSQLF